ncbi:MAG: hypothetical protein NTU59_02835 [Coprothermobacterota bacterium]|nr:hypothetical protein [Coprothermobacterota bacterium]
MKSILQARVVVLLTLALLCSLGPSNIVVSQTAFAQDRSVNPNALDPTGESLLAVTTSGLWQFQRGPLIGSRVNFGFCYDTIHARILLFGGSGNNSVTRDTWSLDLANSNWSERTTTSSPPPRDRFAMAYDSTQDKAMIFGGFGNGRTSDTWAYDYGSNTWLDRAPSTTPTARMYHSMVFDPAHNRLVLFGGEGNGNVLLNDTWEYNYATNQWTERTPTSFPTARKQFAMIYNPSQQKSYLFGGDAGVTPTSTLLADLWTYDYDSNSWTSLTPSGSPPARREHAMAYDSLHQKIVLFGGEGAGGELFDTWVYDIATNVWSESTPDIKPMSRRGHGMTYNSALDRVVMFGGSSDQEGECNDTWTYDNNSGLWANQFPANPRPASSAAMTYDVAARKAVLFGGYSDSQKYGAETYAYDLAGNSWVNRTPTTVPHARSGHVMVYDPFAERTILFGGYFSYGGSTYYDDTWTYEYAANTWSNRTPTVAPNVRTEAAMVFDTNHRRAILFGGFAEPGGLRSDTWEYDSTANLWTDRTPTNAPSNRLGHAMAYDPVHDKVVLFGGDTNEAHLNAQTWVYDYPTNSWTEMHPPSAPSGRSGHSMFYDPVHRVVVLYGGQGPGAISDAWAYDYGTNSWTAIGTVTQPPARREQALVYHSYLGKGILFGGNRNGNHNDTWSLGLEPTPTPIISYTPSTLTFSATQNGSNPAAQTLYLWNSGINILHWTAVGSASWISCTPTSGSSSGEIHPVTVSVTIGGLTTGTYTATLTLSAVDGGNSPQSLPLTLVITPPLPSIGLTPTLMSFSAVLGGTNPANQVLGVRNDGGGVLLWNASKDAGWLSLTPSNGASLGETDPISVGVDIGGLPAGTHSATITISATGASNTPRQVQVSLVISLTPTPNHYEYSLRAGWNQISLPLTTSTSPDQVFGGLPSPWWLFQWNPLVGTYWGKDQISLEPGDGYWLKSNGITTTASYEVLGFPYENASIEIPLQVGWNMIGPPYLTNLATSTVRIKQGVTLYTIDQAADAGLITHYFFWFNGITYEDAYTIGSFEPGKGYWAKAFSLCSLIFYKP